jgi:DnaA N-terminal domain
MSHQAIAAVLARHDLSSGERLVAFSLASFADRDSRARPGTPAAAGRAGLKPSWFLEARSMLVRRGLVVVEQATTGRGRASTLWLPFAETGPWWEGEVNAELLEAVLSYSRSHGTARLLLAAMAALADEQRVLVGVTTERLCAAVGVTDRTYRRARAALLSSGELVLRGGTGGRGNTNRWEIANPRSRTPKIQPSSRRRVAPPPGQRPLLASVSVTPAVVQSASAEVDQGPPVARANGGLDRTVSGKNSPVSAGVSPRRGGASRTLSQQNRPASAGVSGLKAGADRTLSRETPAKTPAKTPAPNARAGREPQNPRTLDPPSPPEGGTVADQVLVEEMYITERGRTRRRPVRVDLSAVRERLAAAGAVEQVAWEQIRSRLLRAVGVSTFEIWLESLELIAVDLAGSLVIDTPEATRSWVQTRFGRLLERCAAEAGRAIRFAEELERLALEPRPNVAPPGASRGEADGSQVSTDVTARGTGRLTSVSSSGAGGRSADRCAGGSSGLASDRSGEWQAGESTDPPPYKSSCTRVYTERAGAS